jgi:hypothetical protein
VPLAAEDPGRFDQRKVGERLREVADVPAAGDELALAAGQAVVGDIGRVARDEAIVAELAADSVDGVRETAVGRLQQGDQPDHQRAGVSAAEP